VYILFKGVCLTLPIKDMLYCVDKLIGENSMKAKKWKGQHPEHYHTVIGEHPEGWLLYVLTTPRRGWLKMKLVAKGRALHKANYWLAYSKTDKCFAGGSAVNLLRENRPLIYEWVEGCVLAEIIKHQANSPQQETEATDSEDYPLTVYNRLLAAGCGPDMPLNKEAVQAAVKDVPEDERGHKLMDAMADRGFLILKDGMAYLKPESDPVVDIFS
jgi:hypothetical protein